MDPSVIGKIKKQLTYTPPTPPTGVHPGVSGNLSGVSGNLSGVWGDLTGITATADEIKKILQEEKS